MVSRADLLVDGMAQQALELAPVMIRDLDGSILHWTHGMARLYGHAAADAIGRSADLLLGTVFPTSRAAVHAALLADGHWSGELTQHAQGGEPVVAACQWTLCRDATGRPSAVTEIHHDITRQKRDEEARLRLAAIVESSDDAIIGKSLDGVVTSWNKAAERMFGYAPAEIVGQSIGLIFPPDRLTEEVSILARLRRGDRIDHYETVRRRRDGTDIDVALTVSPIRDVDGSVVGISKIARDITERRRAEARFETLRAELLHVSRLGTMGQMAATLAHELNQPLTAIATYLSALQRLTQRGAVDGARLTEIAGKAVDQAARAGNIIRRLRQFVTQGTTDRAIEDLNDTVREAVDLALVGARQHGIQVSIRLAPGLPGVLIDRVQIQQVVLNLVRNAVEAMQAVERRELTVETGMAGGLLEVRVADTGGGIPPTVASRLFQPFVTTKKTGMGVGLSICREIVEAHDGRLAHCPVASGGTAFVISLPAAGETEPEPA